jgi:DNA repair exonuclease SbcCD ATPase subunit
MDLFNPPKDLNYTNMTHNLDVTTLENPYVQVVWEDTPENFTQERIKRVKSYFEQKYKSKNINVVTKVKSSEDVMQSVDVSMNILDENYQRELIVKHLENGEQTQEVKEKVLELDSVVERKITAEKTEVTSFKKWYIKKIKFSNFLSFGDNQVLDFDKVKGIATVESNPPNFGGKTVLSVDLLLFLFFNTTTKTGKAEEIFNRFRDVNKVSVEGEIQIDGEDYIIVREVERKMSKKGDWNVSTKLDFFKKLGDGSLQNFTGEQRRETEQFIKTSIGSMDDFLMTILTTATNLEELIDSKPTARGAVLSRFLGLDSLKLKEDTAKEMYSNFSKSMISNVYDVNTLKQQIEEHKTSIEKENGNIKTYEIELKESEDRIKMGQEFRDGLLKQKHTGLDAELLRINPDTLQTDILGFESKISDTKTQINTINVVEPSQYYHEDQHDKAKEMVSELRVKVGSLDTKIKDIESELKEFDGGLQCQYCGIVLAQSEYTEKKKGTLGDLNIEKSYNSILLEGEIEKEKSFTQLKSEFDQYERNKLIKEKLEIQMESFEMKKKEIQTKLQNFKDNQQKLEDNKKIDEKLMKADIRLGELSREKDGINYKITTSRNNISRHQEKISDNLKHIEKIAEEEEKSKIFKLYLEVYGKNGISKMIMKNMMPVINSELQRLLMDSAEFKLEVRISDKNEVEFWMIDNSTAIEKLMSSGSGYERTIASLALRAVLSKVCSLPKPNVVVFDEVFGKISNDNLEMVAEFFHKIKDYFEKILVITHNPMVSQWADTIVKIEKTNNVSKVIQ